jgi:hypothetical protein
MIKKIIFIIKVNLILLICGINVPGIFAQQKISIDSAVITGKFTIVSIQYYIRH